MDARLAKLAAAIDDIEQVHGVTVQPLSVLSRHDTRTPLATGFPNLDVLLDGGLPASALSLLSGAGTSGKTTVALRTIAQAQQDGLATLVIDLPGTFDAEYAHHCGVDLAALAVARPSDMSRAIEIARDAVESVVGVVLVDVGATQQVAIPWSRLHNALHRSSSALLWLSEQSFPDITRAATTALTFSGLSWQAYRGDVTGYRSTVTLAKAPHRHDGPAVELRFALPGQLA